MGFHKNKGIVIELTALLDVIMIMLFWVMMNVKDTSEQAKADADSRVAAAQQQVIEARDEVRTVRAEADKEVASAWEMAENINKNAAANQQALLGYEQGMLVTLNIRYDTDGVLYISNYDEELGKARISSEQEIYDLIIAALQKAELKEDDVILCALVYDSEHSLYKHVKKVKAAVDSVRSVYKSFYCTYIDTSK
ncbi:MAG: hypothetical protein IKO47_11000 [Ruminococcus sp.]|nr:hypothetical protein [Ruminococcus sp.]